MQALFITAAQIGKFTKYYSNPNADGLKGTGGSANTCYFTYTDATALTALTWLNVNSTNDTCAWGSPVGHIDLDVGTQTVDNIKKRMCRGVVLFNNFVDLFTNVILGVGSELVELKDIQDDIANYISNCNASGSSTALGLLCNQKSQSACESTASVANLQVYFAAVFEPLHL